jgi:putative transposase
MSHYIRRYAAGGTFFFTVVTCDRRPLFASDTARSGLRDVLLGVQTQLPFELVATVLLPEHWHCVWALPDNDFDYSKRWGLIKSRFSKLWLSTGGRAAPVSAARARRHERGVWQKRFWEHKIRDEEDLRRHVNYIHFNSVRHGLARCPHEWPHSSFSRWVDEGYYRSDWLCDCHGRQPIVPEALRNGSAFGE